MWGRDENDGIWSIFGVARPFGKAGTSINSEGEYGG